MTGTLVAFDEDDADKIARMAREYDRTMGDRYLPEDYRSVSAYPVSVKLTGPKDPVTGMWPGTFVNWKPGLLAAPVSGGIYNLAAFAEYNDRWTAIKNQNGEVADDCWVIVSDEDVGEFAGRPDLAVVVFAGVVVGQHPTTGTAIVLHSYAQMLDGSGSGTGSGTGTGSDTFTPGPVVGFPVFDIQCLNGVLWVIKRPQYAGGAYGPAYYSHTAGCCDCPTTGSSGGTSPPPPPPPPPPATGGTATCCSRTLSSTLYVTLSGGQGTVTLTWDGTYWSAGPVTLPCGATVYFRLGTDCGFSYSTNGTTYTNLLVDAETRTCTPFGFNFIGMSLGGSCGTLTGSVSE